VHTTNVHADRFLVSQPGGLMVSEAPRERLFGGLAYVQECVGTTEDVFAIDLVKAVIFAIVAGIKAAVVQLGHDLLRRVRALPIDRKF